MDFQILISNLTNPTLLFFVLGIIAALVKSDLEIPEESVKFISLYLTVCNRFQRWSGIGAQHFYGRDSLFTFIRTLDCFADSALHFLYSEKKIKR